MTVFGKISHFMYKICGGGYSLSLQDFLNL